MDKNDPRREPTEAELDELNEHWNEPNDPDGVLAAEEREQAKQAAASQPLPKRYKRKRRWPVVLLILVLLAAATAGAYWFGNRQASAPAATSKTQATQQQTSTQPTTAASKPYTSTTFHVGFDYPGNWKVTESDTKLTVVSHSVQLTTLDGTKAATHVVVTIQNKQATIAGYPATGAIAELASEKIAYKQPTGIQRAQTYISYLGYHKTNGLDAVYITGDNGYQQDQTVPMADVVKSDPLIVVSFETCVSSDCTTGTVTPVTPLASSWKSAAVATQVTDLLKSITLN